jgi:hypothetical protein
MYFIEVDGRLIVAILIHPLIFSDGNRAQGAIDSGLQESEDLLAERVGPEQLVKAKQQGA